MENFEETEPAYNEEDVLRDAEMLDKTFDLIESCEQEEIVLSEVKPGDFEKAIKSEVCEKSYRSNCKAYKEDYKEKLLHSAKKTLDNFFCELTPPYDQEKIVLSEVKPGDFEKAIKHNPTKALVDHPDLPSEFDDFRKYYKLWVDEQMVSEDKKANPASQDVQGMMVFYINVGQMPPEKAESYVQHLKDNTLSIESIPSTWLSVVIPVREGQTRIEQLRF